ncbi:hypothetical protein EDD16DRAFT_1614864 [Pisolithus croceorrhizus]|nr:hypothetical protein EDD16DRAFT_1614864 [Pisolithus croceorrhizus]
MSWLPACLLARAVCMDVGVHISVMDDPAPTLLWRREHRRSLLPECILSQRSKSNTSTCYGPYNSLSLSVPCPGCMVVQAMCRTMKFKSYISRSAPDQILRGLSRSGVEQKPVAFPEIWDAHGIAPVW